MNYPANQPLRTVKVASPMVSLSHLPAFIGGNEDTALALLVEGKLRYAWDIRCSRSRRQCIRILTESVCNYQNGILTEVDNLEAVLVNLFPATRGNPTGRFLGQVFGCSSTHMLDLGREGSLAIVGKCRRGCNGSPHFSRASVFAFLRARRVP